MTLNEQAGSNTVSRRALLAIKQLQARIDELEAVHSEPIAIVGMALRFPGADNPAALWDLLQAGRDAIREVPPDRWDINAYYDPDPDAPGKMVTRCGGFLDQVDQFDAAFFKLSPREASVLDPQHRLLLEVTWESLERARLAPDALPTLTGIFVGIAGSEYIPLLATSSTDQHNRTYISTGTATSTASGRLAHFLNVQGPTYAVDTACSSALVAVHLAVQSLRLGECHLALAGGVNCLLDPDSTVTFSQGRFLAPDGHCKTFDAAADGYVRSEGCGMIVLKRLADAERDGDPILAVIRGSAVNHDGQTSGLTVPSGPSQQAVVRAALANARLRPADIGYVEAHGTGTPLGDPIEVNALGAVFAERDTPLYLGSIKTNMGHLEAAAGMAGLCKVVLALQHQHIPTHLHFQTPNPTVDWASLPIQVTTNPTPWPSGKAAGVSSFGFSGTNAHVILEAAPVREALPRGDEPALPAVLLPLAAKTDAALRDMARAYADHLDAHPDLRLADVAHTAATRRSPFAHRLALVSVDNATARQHLAAFAAGDISIGITGMASRRATRRVAFLFTGQGSQYAGMGRQLYATQPVFRAAIDACAALLQPHLDVPLRDLLWGEGDPNRLHQTGATQPALFALEYALAQVWMAWGIRPAMLLGHSIGEYVAACLAGVFSLEDALTLVAARGRFMQALPPTGQMVAIQADPDQVAAAIQPYAAQVSLAAINGPRSLVIAGETETVQALAARFASQGSKTQTLQTSHAFHSPLMEPMLAAFAQVAQQISYHPPQIPVVSNISGQVADATIATPAYWVQHVRQPVQFAAGMITLATAGVTTYLEVGPHPTLLVLGQQCLGDDQPAGVTWAASLHRERDDWPQMLTNLGHLYVAGVPIAWQSVYPPNQHQRVDLPTYPFQRERYWVQPAPQCRTPHLRSLLDTMLHVPLLKATAFATEVSTTTWPWLADHQVFGRVVMPGAGSLAMLLSAAEVLWETPAVQVRDAILSQPLVIPDAQTRTVQILLQPTPTSNGTPVADAQLVSLPHGGTATSDPTPHVTGTVSLAPPLPALDLAALQGRCTTPVDLAAAPRDQSIVFGPTFRWLAAVWQGDGEALARVVQPDALDSTTGYLIHPALLDACFQLSGFTLAETPETLLPFAIDTLTLATPAHPGTSWWAHARQTGAQRWDLTLFTEAGQVLATVAGFQMRVATDNALLAQQQTAAWLYTLAWREQPLPTADVIPGGRWLVVAARRRGGEEARGAEQTILEEFQRHGQACVTVAADDRDALEAVLTDGQPLQGVLYLATAPDGDPAGIPDQAEAIYTGALHLAQALVQHGQSPRLWLVTRGTHLVQDGETLQVSGAVLWGLGRTLGHEHPELTPTLIDLPATPEADEAIWLTTDLLAATEETQVAYRGGQRWVARLVRYQPPTRPAGPICVELPDYGTLDGLRLVPLHRHAPAAGEVEIAIQAAGLNFRDLLRALGMLQPYEDPNATSTPIRLGFECAGVIAAVGAGVTNLQVGDRVLAITPYGSLASYSTTSAAQVVRMPDDLGFVEAATIPVAFATAAYGLHWLAHLAPGERILIHAAAGGVGQAAVQLARALGAEIFATASPDKWAFLRQQGIQHIFNSRTLDFAEQVLAATNGRGVDVVLNSLTGDFIPRSFAALAPGGRFVEIGKVGIWTVEEAHAHRPDANYLPFDLGEELIQRGLSLRDLLAPVLEQISGGQVQPLPSTTFPITHIQEAFRFMQQARHVGKVVITIQDAAPVRSDASYLITGGLGGLGLTIARALVEQGARHLVLSGRRGARSDMAEQTIVDLEQQGALVQVVPADMANRGDVAHLLATAQVRMPLKGIIHAAGVLDDGMLIQQTPARYQTVAAPKVWGGWHLHTLTRDLPLDFLVFFSSASALFGNAGQTNYAAANAFMDSLAHYRQVQGLPALSINWGAWTQVGLAAERAQVGHMHMTTTTSLTPDQGKAVFQSLLQAHGQVGVIPGLEQISRRTPFLQEVLRPIAQSVDTPATILRQLADTPGSARRKLLEKHVCQHIATVLGRSDLPPLTDGFFDLGMDSLMAVELRNALQKSLNCKLPGTLIFDYPTGNALLQYLVEESLTELFPAASDPIHRSDQIAQSEPDFAVIAQQLAQKLGIGGAAHD